MKVRVQFKESTKVIATIEGKEMPDNQQRADDFGRVIEIEQTIERLTGFRVHITTIR